MGKRRAKDQLTVSPSKVSKLDDTTKAQHEGAANKEKVLILSTRGITFRYRHLMMDLINLMPHSKKDNKLDTKHDLGVLNEVADMRSCTSILFLEARKRQDLYLWLAKSPEGPSVKFLVQNVHTMSELKLSGNHLKGSRPVLSFDQTFDQQPHWQLTKEILTQVFSTPKKHHKSKPFFDHVLSFTIADGRVWFRNYQVVLPEDKKSSDMSGLMLVECGPRMCLNPIKIFGGSFSGPVLYENPDYTSPNLIRSLLKKQKGGKYATKVQSKTKRQAHVSAHPLPQPEFAGLFKGVED